MSGNVKVLVAETIDECFGNPARQLTEYDVELAKLVRSWELEDRKEKEAMPSDNFWIGLVLGSLITLCVAAGIVAANDI